MIIIIYFKYKKFEIINNLFNLIFIKLNKMNFVKTKLIKSSKYGELYSNLVLENCIHEFDNI